MAEGLASAVSVPDQSSFASPPAEEIGLKRKSSITDSDTKRRRLSTSSNTGDREGPDAGPENGADDRVRTSTGATEAEVREKERGREDDRKSSASSARPVRREEERKRGQRLFGALLGTLSQSSNSASQRRRADIERRQQDKLKLQDEEYDGLKKQRRDERVAIRKKEQRIYEEESMQTRHSNLLSMAHFLKTRTEPVLYYRPWQLRPRDEDTIREQIIETEQSIAHEVADFKARYSVPPPDHSSEQPTTDKQGSPTPHAKQKAEEATHSPESAPKEAGQSNDAEGTVTPAATAATTTTTHAASDTVGSETTNQDQSSGDPASTINKPPTTSTSASTNPDHQHHHHHYQHHHHDSHHHPDDGGEVVEEDKEDTVIY